MEKSKLAISLSVICVILLIVLLVLQTKQKSQLEILRQDYEGIKHRCFWNGFLKLCFSVNVSALALVNLSPIFSSFDHEGISPHRIFFSTVSLFSQTSTGAC